ncbi:peptidoglycan recognition protein family protein [Kibdelosporangium phytohabitans]|uniref:Peptidoglycan recognition protein family domain-containing protein n=1 Tax=Kibdelosporangium phytohabitans TaxID=860235 RepID=A0A0N9HTP8_9PSEU|nr:peptidoglycan recognition family protein [Kibdelosporangium phytohabitans]ALG08538.1 hypothetical protein AOZ06_17895 [Kibdelosporangium phytohabitans]MBE1470388.1 hypothetical protein [Kibdelosporangium phytohabitans]
MITRRSLLIGSAAAVTTGMAWAPTARAAACGPNVELRATPELVVTVRTRSGWGADESYRFKDGKEAWTPEYFKPQTLTVHHEGVGTGGDPAVRVRGIHKLHAVDNGWGDIGYHLLIGSDGVIFEGRWSGDDCVPVFAGSGVYPVNAAHVVNFNASNIGVCLINNLNTVEPTPAALESLARVAAVLSVRCGLDPLGTTNYVNPINGKRKTVPTMSLHRDWADTECPGAKLVPKIPQVKARVAELVKASR